MHEVHIDPMPLDRLAAYLDAERAARLAAYAGCAQTLLAEPRSVTSTPPTGGRVAEMLQGLLGYARGAQVETRWLVLDGNPEFFHLTRRIHNRVHGADGDGGPLGGRERQMRGAWEFAETRGDAEGRGRRLGHRVRIAWDGRSRERV